MQRTVLDLEANALENPTEIWVIVCKDAETNSLEIFRRVTQDVSERAKFLSYASARTFIGHNILGYDAPVIKHLLGIDIDVHCDTLIISKLLHYSRPQGHSIEDYGLEFGLEKIKFDDFSKYSQEMEDYCVRDVHICHRVYNKYLRYISDPDWERSLKLEHDFQRLVVNKLHENGFYFDAPKARKLLAKVTEELSEIDVQFKEHFPARLKLIREVHPEYTKHGTLHRKDFRWVSDGDLSDFNGGPFCRCSWEEFNPSSHKQLIEVLGQSGWSPTDKTKTHIDAERELNRLKRSRERSREVDLKIKDLYNKLEELRKTGWKINEENLATLPLSAPSPARLLAKRILLEARRRSLEEWLGLVKEDGRIHGKFFGIGAWTHRMAHQNPNTANIPNEFEQSGKVKYLGKELRSLWRAPKNRLLVGVDAEGIQLRIFAHYINDIEFTQSLVEGKKDDKTDPHSLNQRILGSVCKTRAAAKRFIYALLLGGGLGKLSEILGCSKSETEEALDRLLQRYSGWQLLRTEVFPVDAKRGWFQGLDNRKVRIPGESVGDRKHLAMSGYLQNGEGVVMKAATLKWVDKLKGLDSKLVNFVHDEWQVECPNNMEVALTIAKMMTSSLEEAGKELNLNCPLAGSYWNEDHKDYTIGVNWYHTH